ncbi:hypothetical protein ACQPW3_36195 [Actinosynnema sp. CA-248983]
MKVTVVVCDLCHDRDKPAKPYQVRRVDDGTTADVDLCADDAAPLEALLTATAALAGAPQPSGPASRPKTGTPARSTGAKRRGIQVKRIEDIEREKAANA